MVGLDYSKHKKCAIVRGSVANSPLHFTATYLFAVVADRRPQRSISAFKVIAVPRNYYYLNVCKWYWLGFLLLLCLRFTLRCVIEMDRTYCPPFDSNGNGRWCWWCSSFSAHLRCNIHFEYDFFFLENNNEARVYITHVPVPFHSETTVALLPYALDSVQQCNKWLHYAVTLWQLSASAEHQSNAQIQLFCCGGIPLKAKSTENSIGCRAALLYPSLVNSKREMWFDRSCGAIFQMVKWIHNLQHNDKNLFRSSFVFLYNLFAHWYDAVRVHAIIWPLKRVMRSSTTTTTTHEIQITVALNSFDSCAFP